MALNSNFRTLTADNIEGIVEEKNYLKSSFENGTITGWREMAVTIDASGFPNATPTIGTDASPNAASSLSLSATSTTPLSGSRSLLVTVPTSLSQGHGFISEEFTLDRMDLGKVLTVTFDYERITGTYNFSGTLGSQTWMVYIYDATLGAANWIQPAGFLGMNQSSGPGRVRATFQSSVTAGQKYRVAVIASQAAAGASSIEFDNFTCSRQTAPIGPVVTDWVSWTPTGTWTTNTTYTGRWRRVGDFAEYQYILSLSGAPNATNLFLNLPSGQTIDTTKLDVIGRKLPCASGSIGDASPPNNYPVSAFYNSSTNVLVAVDNAGSTYSILNAVSNTVPITFASGDNLTITFSVPISGWSSQVQLSSDTDTRVVAMSAFLPSNTGTFVSESQITGWSLLNDTHGSFNGSTYSIPVSGFYCVSFTYFTSTYTGSTAPAIRINGGASIYGNDSAVTGNSARRNITITRYFNAGDSIAFWVFTNASISLVAGSTNTYLSVNRLSGPSVVAATETVAMRAVKNTGAQTSNNNNQDVTGWTSKDIDTHNAFNATTGIYTVPVSGTYSIHGVITLSANSTGGRVASVWLNSSPIVSSNVYNTFVDIAAMVFSTTCKCKAGDSLKLMVYQNSGGSLNYDTLDIRNNLNIVRVGN